MQVILRGPQAHEVELVAETDEERQLLKDLWCDGVFLQALDRSPERGYSALILAPKLLPEATPHDRARRGIRIPLTEASWHLIVDRLRSGLYRHPDGPTLADHIESQLEKVRHES